MLLVRTCATPCDAAPLLLDVFVGVTKLSISCCLILDVDVTTGFVFLPCCPSASPLLLNVFGGTAGFPTSAAPLLLNVFGRTACCLILDVDVTIGFVFLSCCRSAAPLLLNVFGGTAGLPTSAAPLLLNVFGGTVGFPTEYVVKA